MLDVGFRMWDVGCGRFAKRPCWMSEKIEVFFLGCRPTDPIDPVMLAKEADDIHLELLII